MRIVIFSLQNNEFTPGDAPLSCILADTENITGNIQIIDIFGSDAQTNEYELGFTGGLNESIATGVALPAGKDIVSRTVADGIGVWNAMGVEVSVYSYNGETMSRFPQASAYEKVSLFHGLYIVKAGNTAFKVFVK